MTTDTYFTELLQWHRSIQHFDYNLVVDWAIRLMESGIDPENVVILASFSKPVNRDEIRPYIYFALDELEMEEKDGDGWVWLQACHLSHQILDGTNLKKYLVELSELYSHDGEYGLDPFCNLHYAWEELKDLEEYSEHWCVDTKGISLNNIEEYVKEAAKAWVEQYRYFLETGTFVMANAPATDWQLPAPQSTRMEVSPPLASKQVKWYQFWKNM